MFPLIDPDLSDWVASWQWLANHPAFFYAGEWTDKCEPGFEEALDIGVWRGDDGEPHVLLECGGWMTPVEEWEQRSERWVQLGMPCHDPNLDSVEPSFEAALATMASKVLEHYGSYPEHSICSHCLRNRPSGQREPTEPWFCSSECRAHGRVGLCHEPSDSGMLRWIPPSEQFDCEHWPKKTGPASGDSGES